MLHLLIITILEIKTEKYYTDLFMHFKNVISNYILT